eukprot:TRINITY_DN3698_c0_g5_i1.p1 TRINITY_DN3698_c0_g5~~TRINITY_DN3698_c0_g5_i1.p1  ORF type:complete len:322 (-),score=66.50 TRINITY_DN3698_c0_g5_i1:59-1024(-)
MDFSANRLGFDMGGNRVSLAKWLAQKGHDVWALEMRGSSLSFHPNYRKDRSVRQYDFDTYIERDLPAAISFILQKTGSKKLHYVGHSMGGMLLYSYMSLAKSHMDQIASGTTIGTSITFYQSSSRYADFLPFKSFAEKVPFLVEIFVPHGLVSKLVAAFVGYWNDSPIEFFQCNPSNTDADIVRKLYKFGFHSIPVKLMFQLASTITDPMGMKNRAGEKCYLQGYVEQINQMVEANQIRDVPPVMLLGGTKDVQCPPVAIERMAGYLKEVYPEEKLRVQFLGKSHGHEDDYGHFDLLVGKRVEREVFPEIEFWVNKAESSP